MKKAIAVMVIVLAVLSSAPACYAGIKDIKDAGYNDEVVNSKLPVVLEFWDYYCIDCRDSGQAANDLADEYSGRISVLSMNAPENPAAAAKYDTSKLPVFYYIKDGVVVRSATGLMTSKEDIVNKLGLPDKAPEPPAAPPAPTVPSTAGEEEKK